MGEVFWDSGGSMIVAQPASGVSQDDGKPRVLVLRSDYDGVHLPGVVSALQSAGYVVDTGEQSDSTGRLPIEAFGYDVVVVTPRALTRQSVPAADLADVECGRLRIDARRRMIYVDESPIRMSAREFTLLHHLAAYPDVVFSRDQLLRAVWGSAWRTEGSVTEYIRRLRILLGPTGIGECIVTRKGFGYSFDPDAVR
jgi:hypothetical protein